MRTLPFPKAYLEAGAKLMQKLQLEQQVDEYIMKLLREFGMRPSIAPNQNVARVVCQQGIHRLEMARDGGIWIAKVMFKSSRREASITGYCKLNIASPDFEEQLRQMVEKMGNPRSDWLRHPLRALSIRLFGWWGPFWAIPKWI